MTSDVTINSYFNTSDLLNYYYNQKKLVKTSDVKSNFTCLSYNAKFRTHLKTSDVYISYQLLFNEYFYFPSYL